MLQTINSASIWLAAFVALVFLTSHYSIGFQVSKFIADIIAFGFISFIVVSVFPAAKKAFFSGLKNGSDRFIYSYWLIFLLILFQHAYIIAVGLLDRPIYLIESPISGLIAISIAIAAAYGIAAPLTGTEKLPHNHIVMMVISGIVSGMIIGIGLGVYFVSGWFYY